MPVSHDHDQFALSGAWNFRDVGGARTVDGERVRPGVLFRASELSGLTDDGGRTLIDLGVGSVFDLRGDAEIGRSGADRVPDGVQSIVLPYENSRGERAPHEAPILNEETQVGYMMRAYGSFAGLDGASVAIKAVADAIVDANAAVLVHCAAGKDRAGWTVATILRAVGVVEEDILTDYLRSNDAIQPLLQHVRRTWNGPGMPDGVPLDAMLGVREAYLAHGYAEMVSLHGSFEGYLNHLGIDDERRRALQAVMLK